MKKYYLAVAKSAMGGSYQVQVTDNPKGMEILKEFEAENYLEAVHRYSFMAYGMNTVVWCGVDVNGKAYHGEA